MILRHTDFNIASINDALAHYHQVLGSQIDLPESISDYDDFSKKLPILHDEDLRNKAHQLMEAGILHGCNFTISSATSSEYKLLAQRLWRSITHESYPYQLVTTLVRLGVFTVSDVVANLFSAGGMSTLYDGCNRLLEGCKTTTLPIGRLDAYPQLKTIFLQLMQRTKVNTLFGTPSSIMQCANLALEAQIDLNIEKIVFTGEMFAEVKRACIKQSFPNIQVYGLYGHNETGFIGINTPRCNNNFYHLLTNYFFIEVSDKGEVLVTDMTKPIIPLFRYYVGDIAELIDAVCSCGNAMPVLLLKGRCDKKFNYMGNLVSYTKIKEVVSKNSHYKVDMQIQLSTNQDGVDLLKIVIDDTQENVQKIKSRILDELIDIDEIYEGIIKGTGSLKVCSSDSLIFTPRQKLPFIYDVR